MKPQTVGQDDGIRTVAPKSGTTSDAAGLLPGSIVLTLQGEAEVSQLRPGDRIISRDCGTVVLRGVRLRHVVSRAVRIAAGSLGHTRPERDVCLPAGQPMLIRDWRAEAIFGRKQAMVPAHRLVDGEFITLCDSARMTVYELSFDAPHIIYVDGLELASHGRKATISKAA